MIHPQSDVDWSSSVNNQLEEVAYRQLDHTSNRLQSDLFYLYNIVKNAAPQASFGDFDASKMSDTPNFENIKKLADILEVGLNNPQLDSPLKTQIYNGYKEAFLRANDDSNFNRERLKTEVAFAIKALESKVFWNKPYFGFRTETVKIMGALAVLAAIFWALSTWRPLWYEDVVYIVEYKPN